MKEAEVVEKYVDGETRLPVAIDARLSALTDNEDGTVEVALMVTKISAGLTTRSSSPYGDRGEIFTNLGVRPAGEWPIRFQIASREVAEGIRGVAEVGRAVVELISDMHKLLLLIECEEFANNKPNKEAARKFNR